MMKKTLLVVAAVMTLLAVLGITGYAFAQTPTPTPSWGGMMGGWTNGSGHMGGMMGANGSYGPMHNYMLKALTEKLNLSVEELQARLDNGETMWDVARAQGLSDDQVSVLMAEAHNQAVKEAVAAGVITQEQADWMNSHMQQMHGNGFSGGCHGGTGTPGNSTGTSTDL